MQAEEQGVMQTFVRLKDNLDGDAQASSITTSDFDLAILLEYATKSPEIAENIGKYPIITHIVDEQFSSYYW